MFLARRRAFARHPLCRVLDEKKGREERNGWEGVKKREERENKKKKRKQKKKKKNNTHTKKL